MPTFSKCTHYAPLPCNSDSENELESMALGRTTQTTTGRYARNHNASDYRIKVGILNFDGSLNIKDFLDSVKTVESFF